MLPPASFCVHRPIRRVTFLLYIFRSLCFKVTISCLSSLSEFWRACGLVLIKVSPRCPRKAQEQLERDRRWLEVFGGRGGSVLATTVAMSSCVSQSLLPYLLAFLSHILSCVASDRAALNLSGNTDMILSNPDRVLSTYAVGIICTCRRHRLYMPSVTSARAVGIVILAVGIVCMCRRHRLYVPSVLSVCRRHRLYVLSVSSVRGLSVSSVRADGITYRYRMPGVTRRLYCTRSAIIGAGGGVPVGGRSAPETRGGGREAKGGGPVHEGRCQR